MTLRDYERTQYLGERQILEYRNHLVPGTHSRRWKLGRFGVLSLGCSAGTLLVRLDGSHASGLLLGSFLVTDCHSRQKCCTVQLHTS